MKKIIALALAGLPLVAMADVNVYGTVKMGLENTRETGNKSVTRIDDYGTRLGFMGGEALGSGLRAIWQAELALDLDSAHKRGITDGTGPFLPTGEFGTSDSPAYSGRAKTPSVRLRDSFIGLDTGYGKVRFGRLSNVFNDSNGRIGLVDNWESNSGANGLFAYSRINDRVNNSVRYDSPDFAGFTFAAQYGLDETELKEGVAAKREPVMGLALNYAHAMGLFAGAGYEASRSYSADTTTGNRWRVEAGYDANNILAVAGYQQAKDGLNYDNSWTAGNAKSKEIAVTLGYRLGSFLPKVSYAKGNALKPTAGSEASGNGYKQFIIGADYNMSKRTVAGLSYGQLKARGGDAKIRTAGVNLVHAF